MKPRPDEVADRWQVYRQLVATWASFSKSMPIWRRSSYHQSTVSMVSVSTIAECLAGTMIPVGYMYKMVRQSPDWMQAMNVDDVYSLSGCVSENFTDYINYWKHNGYWLFDSPALMQEIATEHNLDLSGTTLFYYEVFEKQFDVQSKEWSPFEPERSFSTNVERPNLARLQGYDVTTFYAGACPECSPLSCNSLAGKIATNRHCLFDSFEQAKRSLEAGEFDHSEPGPFRIFAVYTLAS